ncbi:hypothetical protein Hs30E_16740 [Lactococcus hodotermopsidis]|uniref:Uncharacterized protein n=1 Tax=Pseudolactococcus hodotermopsidis TaxID=2709157 RepID=A0A6A0BEJ2_9LACT|nr:hypothetical protein [Lactococcus hodotermopsidis]GFH43123.1 hypothetical protein Hs30E_16740 [Lactococcus hodotermopsidis]
MNICKAPACNKKTITPKAPFCKSHEKIMKKLVEKAGEIALEVVLVGIDVWGEHLKRKIANQSRKKR